MSTSFKSVHGILSICTPPRQREGFHSTQLGVPAKQQRTSARFLFSTPRTASSRRRTPADRFIPTRLGQNSEFSSHALTRTISKSRDRLDRAGIEDDLQENALQEQLLELEGCSSDTRVLNFTPVKSKSSEQYIIHSQIPNHNGLFSPQRTIGTRLFSHRRSNGRGCKRERKYQNQQRKCLMHQILSMTFVSQLLNTVQY